MQPLVEEICSNEVLQPGVLLLFKISSTAQHCGIVSLYQNSLGLIHAWDIAGKVVEHKLTSDWINKVVGCYGLPGVHYF
jgi:cell wall-associated NlpC family hydrolase